MTDEIKPPPIFEVGDEVKSFRGELATVTEVINEAAPHRSHKVIVKWDDPDKQDRVFRGPFYEGVFSPR